MFIGRIRLWWVLEKMVLLQLDIYFWFAFLVPVKLFDLHFEDLVISWRSLLSFEDIKDIIWFLRQQVHTIVEILLENWRMAVLWHFNLGCLSLNLLWNFNSEFRMLETVFGFKLHLFILPRFSYCLKLLLDIILNFSDFSRLELWKVYLADTIVFDFSERLFINDLPNADHIAFWKLAN